LDCCAAAFGPWFTVMTWAPAQSASSKGNTNKGNTNKGNTAGQR
jgi:hypothetical protein